VEARVLNFYGKKLMNRNREFEIIICNNEGQPCEAKNRHEKYNPAVNRTTALTLSLQGQLSVTFVLCLLKNT
jgi:hypothetical protein